MRQGYSLSPLFFSIYVGKDDSISTANEDIKIGGYLLKDIRFADDHGLVVETQEGLQKLMDGLNDVSQQYGMKINVKRTKFMRISRYGGGNLNIILN